MAALGLGLELLLSAACAAAKLVPNMESTAAGKLSETVSPTCTQETL